jgi:hypothetical protein
MGLKTEVGRAANHLLERYGYRLVSDDRLYDWQKRRGVYFHTFRPVALPPDATDYLRPDNPRLLELRARYASFNRRVTEPFVWTDELVRADDLKYFRGDNAYVWQLRGRDMNPLGYALSAYYVRSIDALGLLDKLTEDDAFGLFTFPIGGKTMSRDLLDSVNEVSFLERELALSTRRLNVLDIGAGYGRLAHRMVTGLSSLPSPRGAGAYFCTDAVPVSTFICEYYLRHRKVDHLAKVVPLDEIDDAMAKNRIDLAVNIHSFSECRGSAVDWWCKLLERHAVRYLLVVPNADREGGRGLVNQAGEDFGALIQQHGYRLMKAVPKYADPVVQEYGIASTYYHLFERA